MPWRRERLPTPVFWPGEFQGLYSPWGRKESDTTERLSQDIMGPVPVGLGRLFTFITIIDMVKFKPIIFLFICLI